MLLPIKSKNPPESFPIGTLCLIFINLFVYALTVGPGLEIKERILMKYGLTYANMGPLTMISSMFLHANIFHILGNMWFLYLFGFAVEGRLKTWKFLVIYLVAGLAGDLLHTFVVGPSHPLLPSIGASGAIMGVLGAALYMFPFGKVDFFYWFGWFFHGVFTWPMWGVGILYLGQDLLWAFLAGAAGGGVAHLAHLGGALGGFLACIPFKPKRDSREASDARAMFSETKDLRTLSSWELAAMAASNPNDTTLALNWMHRCLRDNRVTQDCHETFFRLLPAIIQREPIQSVGFVLASIAMTPGVVNPGFLLQTAGRLEQVQDSGTAIRLYDAVMADPKATPQDKEAALFRSAMLAETAFGNLQRAAHGYQEILRHYPMGPFADQARLRLSSLQRRI